MRIVGVLSWYDEPANWLATAVTGFSRFCDTIVAVDGAYALYPGGKSRSHPRQAEAIQLAAEAAGVGLLLYQPQEVWRGNEVEKRNKALDLTATIAEPGDWVCVFDADYHVRECNTEVLRAELQQTGLHVATYTLLESLAEPKTEWTVRTRDLYRWDPTLRVGPTHDSYSTENGWLRGQHEELEDCLDLNQTLVVYHRSGERAQARRNAAASYYKLRDMHGIEDLNSVERVTLG